MIDSLIASGFPPEAIVIIISILPIAELRGALPVGINIFHMPWYEALYLSIIGNLLPVPFLLLFLESLSRGISYSMTGKRIVDYVFKRTRRYQAGIERYGFWGMMIFVAIPLPGTGAWTGSVAAFILGQKFWSAFFSIIAGVVIAGLIVTALSLLGWIGLAITVIALIVLGVVGWWRF